METNSKIFVAGRDTLFGAAIVRRLEVGGYRSVVATEPNYSSSDDVLRLFAREKPEYVFVAAGSSGGISINQEQPAALMIDNLEVACHVIPAAHRHAVKKLLFLASSCSYPRTSAQPMQVPSLMTGPLEPTNEPYAVAKIAGMKLCESYRRQYKCNFVSAIPANGFGPGDDFSEASGHVIASLITRMDRAKRDRAPSVAIWGTGQARRDFIYCDDLADGCLVAMRAYNGLAPINIGSDDDRTIADIAQTIAEVVGYRGELRFDTTRPDGMPVKRLDSSAMRALGWQPKTSLHDAITETYRFYTAMAQAASKREGVAHA